MVDARGGSEDADAGDSANDDSAEVAREPLPTPSVGAAFRSGFPASALHVILLGLGVTTAPILGFGFLFLWVGSRLLLVHAAEQAGTKPSSNGLIGAALAVGLATLLALAGLLGAMLAGRDPVMRTLVATACVAIAGAALSPLALAPVASVTGSRGGLDALIRGVDVAGSDRPWVLAPLCSAIAVALVLPIPFVAYGLIALFRNETPGIVGGGIALAIWCVAVPLSAALLTTRYLRLERANEAPTQIQRAFVPLAGAFAIGLVALGACLGAAAAKPSFLHPAGGPLGSTARPLGGHRAHFVSDTRADRSGFLTEMINGTMVIRRRSGAVAHEIELHSWGSYHPGRECREARRPDARWVIRCPRSNGPVDVLLEPDGTPIPADLADRLQVRVGWFGGVPIALAFLVLALALAWLGRIGASLRLLARPPFEMPGTIHLGERASDGTVLFQATEGDHRVRVPQDQVSWTADATSEQPLRAVLLATRPLERMSYRTAIADAPRDALLVVGAREAALARHVVRARRVGFRLGATGLACLVTASVAILFNL